MDAADTINFTNKPFHQFTETAASIIVAAAAKYRALKDSDAIRNRVFKLLAPHSRVAVRKVLDAIGEKPGSGCGEKPKSVEVPASEVDDANSFAFEARTVPSPIRAASCTHTDNGAGECDLGSDDNMQFLQDVLAVSIGVDEYQSNYLAIVPYGFVFTPENIKACLIINKRATRQSIPFSFVFLLRCMRLVLLGVCSLLF